MVRVSNGGTGRPDLILMPGVTGTNSGYLRISASEVKKCETLAWRKLRDNNDWFYVDGVDQGAPDFYNISSLTINNNVEFVTQMSMAMVSLHPMPSEITFTVGVSGSNSCWTLIPREVLQYYTTITHTRVSGNATWIETDNGFRTYDNGTYQIANIPIKANLSVRVQVSVATFTLR